MNHKMNTYGKLPRIAALAYSKWPEKELCVLWTLAAEVHKSSGSFKR